MATAFTVTVQQSGGDYSTLNAAQSALACDLTSAATKVFGHGTITGTITDGATVTGVTSGATGTALHDTGTQILIKSITGTFQSGEVVYQTLGVNFITISDAGNSPSVSINITGSWSIADTTIVNITGYTTSATNSISIFTSGASTHQGVYSSTSGYYRLELSSAGSYVISCNISNVSFKGFIIKNTSSNIDSEAYFFTTGFPNLTFTNMIFIAQGECFYGSSIGVVNFINCIAISAGGNGRPALRNESGGGGSMNVYNCVAINTGSGQGVRTTTATTVIINCYASSSSGSAYTNTGTITKTTCASADTTGSAGLTNIPYSTATFNNVTSGSENFNLVSGSALIAAGTNESGVFTTDIAGTTRQASGAWDIGAFYYASGVTVNNAIMTTNTSFWGGAAIVATLIGLASLLFLH